MDVTNSYLANFTANVTATFRLASCEHVSIGAYLLGSGLVVGIVNAVGILAFAVYPRALLTPSAVPEVRLAITWIRKPQKVCLLTDGLLAS